MGRMGKFDCKGMKEFQKQLKKLQAEQSVFVESCAKELAARLLRMVVKRTQVGDYSENQSGKKGGTLRRGWISATQEEAENRKGSPQVNEILEYANGLKVSCSGGVYKIEIINPVEYASYVEHGHRKSNHKGWVKGHFMMTISEQELEKIAPKILENKIKKLLEGSMQ